MEDYANQDVKDNLAPFSQFINVSFDHPAILYVNTLLCACGCPYGDQRCIGLSPISLYKSRSSDTVMNCIETTDFIWNMVTFVN